MSGTDNTAKDPMLDVVNQVADAARAGGHDVVGCSFCSQHTPKKSLPCPYCGTMCEPETSEVSNG